MSRIAELAWDIEQLYIEGYRPITIAGLLDCHVDLVYDWIESNGLGAGEVEGADTGYYGA